MSGAGRGGWEVGGWLGAGGLVGRQVALVTTREATNQLPSKLGSFGNFARRGCELNSPLSQPTVPRACLFVTSLLKCLSNESGARGRRAGHPQGAKGGYPQGYQTGHQVGSTIFQDMERGGQIPADFRSSNSRDMATGECVVLFQQLGLLRSGNSVASNTATFGALDPTKLPPFRN